MGQVADTSQETTAPAPAASNKMCMWFEPQSYQPNLDYWPCCASHASAHPHKRKRIKHRVLSCCHPMLCPSPSKGARQESASLLPPAALTLFKQENKKHLQTVR
jgi:hypothetical protein